MELKLAEELKNDKHAKKLIDYYKIIINDNARYLLSYSELISNKIVCLNENNCNVIINVNDIIYFESFNGEVFAKVKGKVLKIKKKLFELEKQYSRHGFIRINKSQVLNIHHIDKLAGVFPRKFMLYLYNGEELDVNRAYYNNFKKKLNI